MTNQLQIRVFDTDDEAYQCSLDVRNRHLRLPLGLNIYDERLDVEADQLHVGLFDVDRLVASVVLQDLGNGTAKLRQMVVEGSRQGAGLGRMLMEGMERIAQAEGYTRIEMAARTEASGFYEKLGYLAAGDCFQEVGIDHIRMTKRI